MARNKHFFRLSFLIIIIMLFVTIVMLLTVRYMGIQTFRTIFLIVAGLFMLLAILFILGFLGIRQILSFQKGENTHGNFFFGKLAFKVFIPVLLAISSFTNYYKNEIRRVYIQANNAYILSRNLRFSAEKILIILPHCLQNSHCGFRLVNGLEGCRQCSACNIGDIKELLKQYGIRVQIATGGTAARKIIHDMKPEFVIAVACERDLSSGLMDVSELPIYGILNQRPKGPCKDTLVDVNNLREAIRRFVNTNEENMRGKR